jgi:acyl-CoA oxidase
VRKTIKCMCHLTLRWKATYEEHRAEYLVDDVSPYMLHMSMFVTTIREQASDEQRAYWLPKIENWEIIGAYAQVWDKYMIQP